MAPSRLGSWKVVAAVVAVGTLLRFWGAFDHADYVMDEMTTVPAVRTLVATGTFNEVRASPLHAIVLAGPSALLGDGPAGIRAIGCLLGSLAILLVWLVARELGGPGPAPLLAAALLAFDPFHVYFSRTPMPETQLVVFFLAFLWAMLAWVERQRPTLPWAGVALGLTIATKENYVLAVPVVVGWALHREWKRRPAERTAVLVDVAFALVLLPAAVYLFTYAPWFARGFTLADLVGLRVDAYWVATHGMEIGHSFYLAQGGAPWQWFVLPTAFGHRTGGDATHGRFLVEINDPVFRPMVLPALAWVAVRAWRARSAVAAAAPILFAACYALVLAVNRPFFSYSALPMLPFAWIGLAQAVTGLARRRGREDEVALAFLAAAAVVGLVLFPLAGGLEVPLGAYAPLLSRMSIVGAP
jgi:dolichyl-phosphate-mannose-protein mannosyltransferase